MKTKQRTQVVLLLTAYFGKPIRGMAKPLSPTEWGRFAQWLENQDILLETLLHQNPSMVLEGWNDRYITHRRIIALLERAGALGFAQERWERAGVWVMTCYDDDYPIRFKKLLKGSSPPLLFGCGDRKLLPLKQKGIAVVGSRDATDQDIAFTSRLAGDAAKQGLTIVSGGARGIDEAAMLGALARNGDVIGILSNHLLRSASSKKYRKGIMDGHLVLLSPFNPEARFNIGNAMARNKYIYCLADVTVVVVTVKGKGGTWSGAMENLRQKWVPLWVKHHEDKSSGNAALVTKGARWLPEGELQLSSLFVQPLPSQAGQTIIEGFKVQTPIPSDIHSVAPKLIVETGSTIEYQPEKDSQKHVIKESEIPDSLGFYTLFLQRFRQLTATGSKTLDEICDSLKIQKTQCNEWLKCTVNDGYTLKKIRPVRYQWQGQPIPTAKLSISMDLYDLFLMRLKQLSSQTPVTPEHLLDSLDIRRAQFYIWLNRALKLYNVRKLTKPVRYQWSSEQNWQTSLFDSQNL